jgi:hypothetical protein
MAGRSGDTFKKRQKEVARAEKHREKLAKRLERKQHKGEGGDLVDENGLAILDDDDDLFATNDLSEDVAQSEESGASRLG